MSEALPALPTPAAAAALPAQPAPLAGQPPLARPPGRPADDPVRQEERTARHAERKRVEAVLPKRALDSKLQVYRKDGGRVRSGARPILTVLVSDLERAVTEENGSADEIIVDRLIDKLGDRADGTYEVVTVDRRGQRLADIPAFEVLVGDAGDDEDDEGDEGDEGGEGGDYTGQDFIGQVRSGAHAVFPQQQPPPPPAPPVDLQVIDELGRRNRHEAKEDAGGQLAVVMQAMMSAQQQQTQLLVAAMQNANKPADNTVIVGVITALAPILGKLLEPKEDPITKVLLAKMLEDKANPSDAMMKMIPEILGEVSKQQMSLQQAGAQQAIAIQGELSRGLVKSTLESMHELQRRNRDDGDKNEKGDGEGESTMSSIAKIAAAVLPSIMGGQQQEAPPPALPAPAEAPRQARVVRAVPKAPAPAPQPAPAEEQPAPAPQPAPRPQRDPNTRIRQCLMLVADLKAGRVPAERYVDALAFIARNAPAPMNAAIQANSMPEVLKVGTAAVLTAPPLLQWIADESNQGFLTETLRDVRALVRQELSEATVAARIAGLQAMQRQPAAPPAAPAPAEASASAPAPAPAATAEPVTPPAAPAQPPAAEPPQA